MNELCDNLVLKNLLLWLISVKNISDITPNKKINENDKPNYEYNNKRHGNNSLYYNFIQRDIAIRKCLEEILQMDNLGGLKIKKALSTMIDTTSIGLKKIGFKKRFFNFLAYIYNLLKSIFFPALKSNDYNFNSINLPTNIDFEIEESEEFEDSDGIEEIEEIEDIEEIEEITPNKIKIPITIHDTPVLKFTHKKHKLSL